MMQMLRICFFILFFQIIVIPSKGQPLVINELMQSDVNVFWNELCEYSDSWVELYNTSPDSISLADYKIGIKAWVFRIFKVHIQGIAVF